MHFADIANPSCKLEQISVELTQKLDELTKNYINQYIPEDSDAHKDEVLMAYMAMYNASINFVCHSILQLRDKLHEDSQKDFLEESKRNISVCLEMMSPMKKEVK